MKLRSAARYVKAAAAVGLEALLHPAFSAAWRLLPDKRPSLLAAQNRLRARAIGWILPGLRDRSR